jgi:hypothetical protein
VNNNPRRRHLHAVPDPEPGDRFATVRSIGGDPVPQSIRAEMLQAAELWESLHDDGKQLRYEVDPDSGRVSVDLFDLDGDRLRAVPLADALGAGDDDSPAA